MTPKHTLVNATSLSTQPQCHPVAWGIKGELPSLDSAVSVSTLTPADLHASFPDTPTDKRSGTAEQSTVRRSQMRSCKSLAV